MGTVADTRPDPEHGDDTVEGLAEVTLDGRQAGAVQECPTCGAQRTPRRTCHVCGEWVGPVAVVTIIPPRGKGTPDVALCPNCWNAIAHRFDRPRVAHAPDDPATLEEDTEDGDGDAEASDTHGNRLEEARQCGCGFSTDWKPAWVRHTNGCDDAPSR